MTDLIDSQGERPSVMMMCWRIYQLARLQPCFSRTSAHS